MLGWVVRIFMMLAGVIASWFVSKEAHNFEIIQMVVSIFLFVLVIAIAAFWPHVVKLFKKPA